METGKPAWRSRNLSDIVIAARQCNMAAELAGRAFRCHFALISEPPYGLAASCWSWFQDPSFSKISSSLKDGQLLG